MSETLIVDLKELETKVENGKGFNHKEATVILEFVRKIIGNGGTVQPQLTIPKIIADILDVGYDIQSEYQEDVSWIISNMDFLPDADYDEFYTWLEASKENNTLALTYLAGKALGVDLVKVGEG